MERVFIIFSILSRYYFLSKSIMTKRIIPFLLLVALVTAPLSSYAAVSTTAVYNTMNTQEKIAYLYGMIAQLQMLLELKLEQEGSSDRSDIDVDTLSATDIEEDEAELRMRIDLNREDEARVWFEYGEDDDDMDERTAKRTVTDSRGDEHTVSIIEDGLDADERYYFRAVAEDENGDRSYGDIRNFRTDDDGGSGGSSSSGDFELTISDTTVDAGDEVEIEWEIPEDDAGTRNWLGLYEVGESNQDYVKWVYIDNDESGVEYFTIDSEGEFEFRLFLNNSYDDEVTSDEIEAE